MKVNTQAFGEVEVNEQCIYTFDNGIYGFFDLKKFALITEEDSDFVYLQSIDDVESIFILYDYARYNSLYNPIVSNEQVQPLGELKNNLLVYNICTVRDNIEDMTVNLIAPIVINEDTRKGAQVIVENDNYTTRHKFFDK